jgi:hypothetical protein
MEGDGRSDYQLTELSRRLQRRQGWLVTTGLIAWFTPVVLIGVSIDGSRVRPGFVIGCLVVIAVSITLNRFVHHSMSPADRSLMTSSQRRQLEPLPSPDPGTERRILLTPGRKRPKNRPADDQRHIVITAAGITMPIWILVWAPRRLERDAQATLSLHWGDIEQWHVRSDSDGYDTYDIETSRPWFDTTHDRWPAIRVHRTFITDEVALLDAVRSYGTLRIQLETSLSSGQLNPAGPN